MSHIRPGYSSIMPYISVVGADRFIEFLVDVFDATELERHAAPHGVAHASVKIGEGHVELAEARPEWPATPCAIHIYVPDVDATHARAMAAGAVELHAPTDQPYGERSSAVRDPFGNNWYIATWL